MEDTTPARVPFSEPELEFIRQGARYGVDYSKWLAGLATLAIGGAGIGLTDKIYGLGVIFFLAALGAMVLSLVGATLCLLTLGTVALVKAETTLADFTQHSHLASLFMQVQLWSFLAGIIAFALAIGNVVL